MRITSDNEIEEAYAAAKVGALKGGLASLALSSAAAAYANKRYPGFRSLSTPGKVFLVTAATIAGVFIAGEETMMSYSKEHLPSKVEEGPSELENAKSFLIRHRYPIIGTVWGASMVGSLAYSLNQPHLKLSQKLVTARMYAQFATIAVLLLTAAATQVEEPVDNTKPLPKTLPFHQ